MSGSNTWARPDDLIGETLEKRYRLVRLLGEGGMGAVFEARHLRLDKRVAVKVLHPRLASDERQCKRFLREARAANRIASENVVEILDFGEDPVTHFVMEFLDGQDLAALVRAEGKLGWGRARALLLQVLAALGAAHDEGIVHRDVKPSNVFVRRKKDGTEFVTVLDFGIAKSTESSPETRGITRTDEVVGTVAYMAPEQAMGDEVDARTDVYATGVVLFEMLTGAVPFTGTNQYKLLDAHVRTPPPRPCKLEPTIPEAVEQIVLRALAKDPADRFQDMDEFIDAVEHVLDSGYVLPRSVESTVREPPPRHLMRSPGPSVEPEPLFAPQAIAPPDFSIPGDAPVVDPTMHLDGPVRFEPDEPGTAILAPDSAAPLPRHENPRTSPPPGQPHRSAVAARQHQVEGESTLSGDPRSTASTISFEGRPSLLKRVAMILGGAVIAVGAAAGGAALLLDDGDETAETPTATIVASAPESTDAPEPAPESPAGPLIPAPTLEPIEPPPAEEEPTRIESPEHVPTEPEPAPVPEDPNPPRPPESKPKPQRRAPRAQTTTPKKPKSDAATMRSLKRKALKRCSGEGPVLVTFQVMHTGKAFLVKTKPVNECVKKLVAATVFPTREKPEIKSLTVAF